MTGAVGTAGFVTQPFVTQPALKLRAHVKCHVAYSHSQAAQRPAHEAAISPFFAAVSRESR